jgi:hypothetical protein
MNLLATKQQIDALGNIDSLMPTIAATQQGPITQNLDKLRNFVAKCRGIPGIEKYIVRVEQNQGFQSTQPTLRLNPDLQGELFSAASDLKDYIKSLASFLNALGVQSPTESDIYVQFRTVGDLPAFKAQLETLQLILEQTILDSKIGGKMEIRSIDKGSIWLHLYIGSIQAVGFVGSIAWSAAVVYKKFQEGRLVEQHVESLKIKNEALKQIQEAQEKLLKDVVEAEAKHLEKEIFGEEENPDRLERIKHAIRLMQELLEKGAEVHPALMAPENVKNLFPDFKKLGAVESRIKKITENAGG